MKKLVLLLGLFLPMLSIAQEKQPYSRKGQGFVYLVDELDKTKNYYVYCKAGGRSAQACAIMNQLGFENTFNLLIWEKETVVSNSAIVIMINFFILILLYFN